MVSTSLPSILISINTTWNVVNFRSGLIRALCAEGFKVVVASPPDDYVDKLLSLGVRYEPFHMDARGVNPFADVGLWHRYRKLMQAIRPQLYLGYTIKPNIFGSIAAHQLRIPVINNISGLGSMFIHPSWMTRLVSILYRHALERSHTVFFQNPDDQALFLDRSIVHIDRCAQLPGSGIDLVHFQSQPLPESPPFRFLFIGRMLWEKGIGEYVQAAQAVLHGLASGARKPQFQVLGARDANAPGQVPDRLWSQWLSQGLIEDLGSTSDVRPFIAQAHCVVLPSYREGTPRALLEAAASARAMITTRVPGCVAVVRDGVNGLLCEPQSSASLANCMRRMLAMKPASLLAMGQKARSMVEREFDETLVIAKYREAIHHALKRPDSPGTL